MTAIEHSRRRGRDPPRPLGPLPDRAARRRQAGRLHAGDDGRQDVRRRGRPAAVEGDDGDDRDDAPARPARPLRGVARPIPRTRPVVRLARPPRTSARSWSRSAPRPAASATAADIGSALHSIIEQINKGHTPQLTQDVTTADIDAYTTTIAAAGLVIDPHFCEATVVVDQCHVAGMSDMLRITVPGDGDVVGDLKTGDTLDWSWQPNMHPAGDLRPRRQRLPPGRGRRRLRGRA